MLAVYAQRRSDYLCLAFVFRPVTVNSLAIRRARFVLVLPQRRYLPHKADEMVSFCYEEAAEAVDGCAVEADRARCWHGRAAGETIEAVRGVEPTML